MHVIISLIRFLLAKVIVLLGIFKVDNSDKKESYGLDCNIYILMIYMPYYYRIMHVIIIHFLLPKVIVLGVS